MGEKSKSIGEFGENITEKFLGLIGWTNAIKGSDIECSKPIEHSIKSSKQRNTHGIDFTFYYKCQLFEDTQENIIISSKTQDTYENNPSSKFKAHTLDLALAIECYKKSSLRSNIKDVTKTSKYTGVLFWIDLKSNYDDLLEQVNSVRLEMNNIDFESIYLVDNRRASFVYEAIQYSKNKFRNSEIKFIYPYTGYNNSGNNREFSGGILPVQYINSSILPLHVINKKDNKEYLIINCIEKYSVVTLKRLIGLAQKFIQMWITIDVHILFPELNFQESQSEVNQIKLEFLHKENIMKNITVGTFSPDFRSIE